MPTVLIIDDDADFREFLTALLERQGYSAVGLSNGEDLPRILRTESIDAVVTDLYMPQMDGLEVISFFQKYDPSLPVFGVTGSHNSNSGVCVKAMSAFGARDVFPKPLNAAELLGALDRALGRRSHDPRQVELQLEDECSDSALTWDQHSALR